MCYWEEEIYSFISYPSMSYSDDHWHRNTQSPVEAK